MTELEKKINTPINKLEWEDFKWADSEYWGRMHPDKQWMLYDPDCIEKTSEGLVLDTTYKNYKNGKYYYKEGGKTVPLKINPSGFDGMFPIFNVGLIASSKQFLYGTFEIECKLPNHPYAWPAFWLWGGSWPPEIDIFEGYTNRKGSYFKFRWNRPFGFWNVQTNLHYGNHKDNTNDSVKANTHWFGLKNPSEHFMKYKCEWTPEHVKIWYNNKLVRTIKEHVPQVPMRVILNNGFTAEAMEYYKNNGEDSYYLNNSPNYGKFIIKDFNYKEYDR